MSRFKGRPASGLPERLPEGETLLWQGAPDWKSLARYAFRVRIIGCYFAALVTWRVGASLLGGHSVSESIGTCVNGTFMGVVSVAMFCVFAMIIARTTTYTITSKRVVITYGAALPKSVNLPFSRLEAADMRVDGRHTGDIVLRLPEKVRLSYLLLWPHVHAGKNGRAEPVLRCIAAPAQVAEILTGAVGRTMVTTVAEPAAAKIGLQAHAA
jgi:hypothetical protein